MNKRYYVAKYNCLFGKLEIICSEIGLACLCLDSNKNIDKIIPKGDLIEDSNNHLIIRIKKWLDDYFNGLKPDINSIPFDITGTKFQLDIWKLLIEIPYGKTVTYNYIAKEIAKKYGIEKMSAQAVGTAIGRNPISIIIPCHRVIGSNGSLTGYASGIATKIKLLEIEGHKF